jgi:hypothetical protein
MTKVTIIAVRGTGPSFVISCAAPMPMSMLPTTSDAVNRIVMPSAW